MDTQNFIEEKARNLGGGILKVDKAGLGVPIEALVTIVAMPNGQVVFA